MAAGVPVNSERRDWFRIIRDLNRVGVSAATIGAKCNRSASTVIAWAEGGDPKETDARIVLALYSRHCPLKYMEHQRHFEIRLDDAQHVDGETAGSPTEPPDLEDAEGA